MKKEKDEIGIKREVIKKVKIKVIGIGGGGGSIISELSQRLKRMSFLVADTDSRALKNLKKNVSSFQFGQALTKGLGTGMDIQLAKEAALKEKEKIKKILQGQDLVIFLATLGGGVGSGASQVFAKIARKLDIISYGIFTLPFVFEGERKKEIAFESLRELKKDLSALTVIPNERIFQIVEKNNPLKIVLSTLNKILAENLEGLIETIFLPGLINIDFADLKTVLKNDYPVKRGKLTYLNSFQIPLEKVSSLKEVKEAIPHPLYSYNIDGAKGVLFNIIAQRELDLSQVKEISEKIYQLTDPQAKIIFGVSLKKERQNFIKVVLLATGCRGEIVPKLAEKSHLPLTEKIKKTNLKKKIERKSKIEIPKPAKLEKEEKVRKNALEIQRETIQEEAGIIKEEEKWEEPTFFRRKISLP